MVNGKASAIARSMDAVDRFLVLVAQLLLAGMMILTFVNVVGRTFFHQSIPDSLTMTEMLMVAIVFLPLSYVQSMGAHLEVTVLSDLLPIKIQRALFSVGLVLGIVIFGLITWMGWLSAYESFKVGGYGLSKVLYIPEWPARMMIPLGLGWWCLRMLTQLLLPDTRPEVADSEIQQVVDEVGDVGRDNRRSAKPGA